MTSDKEILQTVLGLKLEFFGDPPVKHNSYIPQFSKEDESAIDLESQKLLAKGVITKCEHETGEYISPIFIRQKPDGSCRLILNLKNLNEDMHTYILKWKHSVLSLITPGCYLAALDLKVIRQKGENQNECFKKTKHVKFSEKRTFLIP